MQKLKRSGGRSDSPPACIVARARAQVPAVPPTEAPLVAIAVTAILTLAISVAAGAGPTQVGRVQDPAEFDSQVDIVRLNVAVIHPSGGEVPPLTVDDFEVYDNGVRQEIQYILPPSETPLNVALVIDYSPSVQPYQHSMQRAAIGFLAGLSGDDCPYVLPFSEQIGPGKWGRYLSGEWERFLRYSPVEEGTSLFDALLITLAQLDLADEIAAAHAARAAEQRGGGEKDAASEAEDPVDIERRDVLEAEAQAPSPPPQSMPSIAPPETLTREELTAQLAAILPELLNLMPPLQLGNCSFISMSEELVSASPERGAKKAILLFSDGSDNASVSTLQDLVAGARLASVPIFPVVLGPATRDARLMARLTFLARSTGGLLVESDNAAGLTAAFQKVFAYAKSYYLLAYDPDRGSADRNQAGRLPAQEGNLRAAGGGEGLQTGAWHTVRVDLRRPLLQAITRPGYYR